MDISISIVEIWISRFIFYSYHEHQVLCKHLTDSFLSCGWKKPEVLDNLPNILLVAVDFHCARARSPIVSSWRKFLLLIEWFNGLEKLAKVRLAIKYLGGIPWGPQEVIGNDILGRNRLCVGSNNLIDTLVLLKRFFLGGIDRGTQFIELIHNFFLVSILLAKHRKHCPELDACFPAIFIKMDNVWKLHLDILAFGNIFPMIESIFQVIKLMFLKNLLSLWVPVEIEETRKGRMWGYTKFLIFCQFLFLEIKLKILYLWALAQFISYFFRILRRG